MKKDLTIIAGMSGTGKSTYASANFDENFILPDTNKSVHKIYHDFQLTPYREAGKECELLTSIHLLGAKYVADRVYLGFNKDVPGSYLTMRSYVDYYVWDYLYMNRRMWDLEKVKDLQLELLDQFDSYEWQIWELTDEEVMKKVVKDESSYGAWLVNYSIEGYKAKQEEYINLTREVLDQFGISYKLIERNYGRK